MKNNFSFKIIWGIVMCLIYLAVSLLLVFSPIFVDSAPLWARIVMGLLFFLYGIFRGYRVWKLM